MEGRNQGPGALRRAGMKGQELHRGMEPRDKGSTVGQNPGSYGSVLASPALKLMLGKLKIFGVLEVS